MKARPRWRDASSTCGESDGGGLTYSTTWYTLSFIPHMDHREIERRIEQFKALCRAGGFALTVQRRTIFEVVLRRDDHPTADQIYQAVRRRIPGLSRTTVYRVLETLAGLGAVRRLDHAGGTVRFDGRVERHHHLVCVQCHRVVDFEDRGLDRITLPPGTPGGFKIDDYSVHLLGRCARCRKRE